MEGTMDGFGSILRGNEIDEKEYSILQAILKNYDFILIEIQKVRSAYKVITTSGCYCLKKMKHGKHKVRNGYILVEQLNKNNFLNVARYIKDKNGNLYVCYNRYIFYVTEWIDGDECDLKNMNEALNCVQLLANFHIASKNVDVDKLKIRNNLKNWPKLFTNNLNEMASYKKLIERKVLKTEFDIKYGTYIDKFYSRGLVSINVLNKSEYYKISREANENKTICHDSFYYQNILCKDNNYFLVDLDSIIIDLQINDLGKLLRRLMTKKDYLWNFQAARKIIEAYSNINPLRVGELEAMLALIIFPHKFWKLGKKRYVKHKNWSEFKYTSKLNKIVEHCELQDIFINDYLTYMDEMRAKEYSE